MSDKGQKRPAESREEKGTKKTKTCDAKNPTITIINLLKSVNKGTFKTDFAEFAATSFGARVAGLSYLTWVANRTGVEISWKIKTTLDPKYLDLIDSDLKELRCFVQYDAELIGFCDSPIEDFYFRKVNKGFATAREIEERQENFKHIAAHFDEEERQLILEDCHNRVLTKAIDDLFKKERQESKLAFIGDLPKLLEERVSPASNYWFHPQEEYFILSGVYPQDLRSHFSLVNHQFFFDVIKPMPYNDDNRNEDALHFSISEFQKKLEDPIICDIVSCHVINLFYDLLK